MPVIQIQPYEELNKKIEEYARQENLSKADAVIKMLEKVEVKNV